MPDKKCKTFFVLHLKQKYYFLFSNNILSGLNLVVKKKSVLLIIFYYKIESIFNYIFFN
jgi:hypothetical protein